MASTPSPVPKSADPAVIINANAAAAAAINGSSSLTPQRLTPMEPPKLNQRGQNKPKCIKCGNVARSRCPFQSCKNCCAKAQNPCHIHVLKQSSILPDKAPPSTTPLPEQPSSDTPSTGASWRLSSLRQLSAAFANSMRAKKPLTRKDYININKWRFLKLREHIEGNIEAEKEAFDRYILNLSLLEETFSTDGSTISDGKPVPEPTSEEFQKLVSSIKVKVKSKVKKSDSCRKRTRILVSQLLKTLEKSDLQDENSNDPKKLKKGVWRAERNDAFNDLIDKLSKAGTEDDLKYISEMKVRLLNPSEGKAIDSSGAVDSTKALLPEQEPHSSTDLSFFSLPKMCTVVTTNEEVLSKINAEVTSLCQLG